MFVRRKFLFLLKSFSGKSAVVAAFRAIWRRALLKVFFEGMERAESLKRAKVSRVMLDEILYGGEVWQYAFVEGGLGDARANREFAREVIRAYKSGQRKVGIKGDGFEGVLKRDRFVTIGGLGGEHYSGVVECESGKREVGVIVWKRIEAELN
ncbi:hypothetical protein D6817_05005 [Candidatus Pacearchaeota archaeon]|nr:MAG: hypothetical protein D6817_05005 [Candidatus Pacearchaeota archaeon]